MRFVRVMLEAPARRLRAMADFYGRELGLDHVQQSDDRLTFATGETTIEFVAGAGEPFYHFALLLPGNRFEQALDWARARTELLPDPESGARVFDFDAWDASACYFEDPAGTLVELIAHHGVADSEGDGPFHPGELVGLSELGLVGDARAMARPLAVQFGLKLWDGTLDEPAQLAFVGERARTFILAPPGRGWLPTGRPAEQHPVETCLAGVPAGELELEGCRYRITSAAAR